MMSFIEMSKHALIEYEAPTGASEKKRLVCIGSGATQHLECWDANWKLPFKRFAALFRGGSTLDFGKITDYYYNNGLKNDTFERTISKYYSGEKHKDSFDRLTPITQQKVRSITEQALAGAPATAKEVKPQEVRQEVRQEAPIVQMKEAQSFPPTSAVQATAETSATAASLGQITHKNLPDYMHRVEIDFYAKKYPHKKAVKITYNGERNWVELSVQDKYEALKAHALPHQQDTLRPSAQLLEKKLFDAVDYKPDGSPVSLLKHDPRTNHGRDHAMEVAIFTIIFAHLYEKHLQAKPSTQELFMMLLSGAFHDSGRQTEGIDIDEERSADNIRKKLTEWGVSESEVAICYNAIIKKDIGWEKKDKSLVAKCLQCADSMAYARLGNWEAKYSDLFKETRATLNPEALKAFDSELSALKEEMSGLIFEVGYEMRPKATKDTNYFSEILKIINEKYPKMREILQAKQVLSK